MSKRYINTEKAPKVNGCYSKGVVAGQFLYTSGQLPIEPTTGKRVHGNVEEQTKQVLQNIEAIVKAAGGTMADVIKCTVYVTDMDNFDKVNDAYSAFFSTHPPARCCVGVTRLHFDFDVEIDAIAYLDLQ